LIGFAWILYDFCFPKGQSGAATQRGWSAAMRFLGLEEASKTTAAARAGKSSQVAEEGTQPAVAVAPGAVPPDPDRDDEDIEDDNDREVEGADAAKAAPPAPKATGSRRAPVRRDSRHGRKRK
jgi:hypothetical protein